jgi:hypothetical protein
VGPSLSTAILTFDTSGGAIAVSPPLPFTGTLSLTGSNAVTLASASFSGTASVTVSGTATLSGVLQASASGAQLSLGSIANPLVITATSNLTLTVASPSAHTLRVMGTSVMQLSGGDSFLKLHSGVTVDGSALIDASGLGGTLILDGCVMEGATVSGGVGSSNVVLYGPSAGHVTTLALGTSGANQVWPHVLEVTAG